MVQQANVLESKTEDLSLIPGFPTMEGEQDAYNVIQYSLYV